MSRFDGTILITSAFHLDSMRPRVFSEVIGESSVFVKGNRPPTAPHLDSARLPIYPAAQEQHWWVDKTTNVLNKTPKSILEAHPRLNRNENLVCGVNGRVKTSH